ncbi:ccch and ring finger protein [Grosmannia clavigera kw1407]|uniref:Pre-mRNA-splicing factor CWC24 n=1 Tax=Grosmannia clavigera (strain kw1407 / UAMH 11150) TaxID=655863 RepID=F0XBN0_GROCL|nr:ccch and ring finger protein [Grosmannia clavigera kw1407]EFX05009.1 ccch and ring finger protein [Grosmannia clavigera kw1407]
MTDATEPSSAPAALIAPVLFKARGRGKAKANMRKRSPTPPPARPADSDSDSDSDSDGGLRGIKRRKRTGGAGMISAFTEPTGATATSSSTGLEEPLHITDRSALLSNSDAATKQSHWFDDTDSKSGKAGKSGKTKMPAPTATPASAPAARSVGPVKSAANIRTITITDFAPDVCKDYKLTGFCGFGDNCKFLHAREDYKQGWQLDNEWEAVTKGKKHLGGTVVASADRSKNAGAGAAADDDGDDEEAMLRDIPFACIICRSSYKQPVVTRCGHYFCERCALTRYRRDPTCAACGSATTGVFNNAKRLSKLLERKRERAAQRRQAAIDAGEELSSEEEEEAGEEAD